MVVMRYRTQDGLADYGFSIEFHPGAGWRVYIMFDFFCGDQDDGMQLPYESLADDGRRYVDWPSKLDGLGDAETVAGLWAELAQRHQRDQEKHKLYVELIQRCWRTEQQRGDGNEAANGPNSPDAA